MLPPSALYSYDVACLLNAIAVSKIALLCVANLCLHTWPVCWRVSVIVTCAVQLALTLISNT